MKGPRWTDVHQRRDLVDSREYATLWTTSGMGTSSVTLRCPFCSGRVVAYIWSLAGRGKRCECGALYGSVGLAHHWKTYQEVS